MGLTPQQQQRIIEQESAWIDSSFGGIDLSAYPALNPLPDNDFHDPRFARDYRDTPFSRSAADLRKFLHNPDSEALQRAGTEIGNEELLDEVRDIRGGEIAHEFKQQTPDYLPSDRNYENIVELLAESLLHRNDLMIEDAVSELVEHGHWTVANIKDAWQTLKREGAAELQPGTPRDLTTQERLHVIRIAQQGNVTLAIGQFLSYALDEEAPGINVAHDPRYRKICDRATLFCFEAAQTDYTPTPERREFLRRYCAGRPLTIAMLQQAWTACQRNESLHQRDELLGISQQRESEAPSHTGLDALDDRTVERLYHDSLRQYVKTVKRGSGIMA